MKQDHPGGSWVWKEEGLQWLGDGADGAHPPAMAKGSSSLTEGCKALERMPPSIWLERIPLLLPSSD